MMETWRLVDVEYRDDPFMNMSVEEAIPRAVGEGKAPNTVRFWHNSNTIVLGCFHLIEEGSSPGPRCRSSIGVQEALGRCC